MQYPNDMTNPPRDLIRAFDIVSAQYLTETPIARLWKTQLADGRVAALKVYHRGEMGSEAAGVAYMRARSGHGAAEVYAANTYALLLEWLEGPSLGDLVRAGDDETASRALGHIAQRLSTVSSDHSGESELDEMFQLLFKLAFAPDCPPRTQALMTRAQVLAEGLLASQPAPAMLHGDLHHDNVRKGENGFTAFDPKGLRGDPAFELANAFRNPKGAMVHAPAMIQARADIWSDMLGVDRGRLLDWAAAKSAWSIALRARGQLVDDPEVEVLQALLAVRTIR